MADIVFLEDEIKRVDPSTFQRLCDYVMLYRGAKSLNSLGNVSGRRKTKKGTPDSFYYDEVNRSYVFCEYTTESKDISSKVLSDIQKCLVKAQELDIKVSEIVFIHSTNSLKIEDDKSIRDYYHSKGVLLTTIGLTELADIVNKNKHILKTFFTIDETNRSIMSLFEFINDNSVHSSRNMSYSFIGREKELNEIIDACRNNRFIFVSGESGCGKTRTVVEALKRFEKRVICVNRLYVKAIDNLLDALSDEEEAIVFVDDINEVSYAKDIINALNTNSFSKIKLIATIRNYALFDSISELFETNDYQIVQIGTMDNENIIDVLKTNLNIINSKFLDRIVEIANGNIRIAILAGEHSLKYGLTSLYNSESLLVTYYKHRIADQFGDGYSQYIKAMFVVAFLNKVDISNLEKHAELLSFIGIEKEDLKQKCRDLTKLEVFQSISDRVFSVDDQSLSNFIIYDSLVSTKVVDLNEFLKISFKNYADRVVDALNIIIKVYTSKDSSEFIKNEVLKAWDFFKNGDNDVYDNFVAKFASLNEEEAICHCNKHLFGSNKYQRIVTFEAFEKPSYSRNKYLNILETLETTSSIHSIFKALEHSVIRNDAYACLDRIMTVESEDFDQGFSRFAPILEEIKNTKGELLYNLMILASSKIHEFHFSYSSFKSNRQLVSYYIELKDEHTAILAIRHQLWESACALSDDEKYDFVAHFFEMYPTKETKTIFKNDLVDAEKLLESVVYKQELRELDIYIRAAKHLKRTGVTWPLFKKKYEKQLVFLTKALQLNKEDYDEEGKTYSKQIDEYLNESTVESFKEDIELLSSICALNKGIIYKANSFLTNIISKLETNNILTYSNAILSRDNLASNSVLATIANRIITLFDNPYEIIKTIACIRHDLLLLFYFERCAETNTISDITKVRFEAFVNQAIKKGSNCFNEMHPSVAWKMLSDEKIMPLVSYVFEMTKAGNKILPFFLDLLFNPYSEPRIDQLFKVFIDCGRLDTLFDIFVYDLAHSNNNYGASDYAFSFALVNIKYLKQLASFQAKSENHLECYPFKGLWNQQDSKLYVKIIFDEFVRGYKYPSIGAFYLKHILDLAHFSENKSLLFIEVIKELYESYLDNEDVLSLIQKLVNEMSESIRIEFLIYLISRGMSPEELSHYNFFSSVESYTDSYVPVINKKINFFERLRAEINKNPKLIDYSRRITLLINDYIRYREEIKIKEAVDGLF